MAAVRACANCSKEANDEVVLKACARCHKALYCGKECQAAAWKAGHKLECGPAPAKPAAAGGHGHSHGGKPCHGHGAPAPKPAPQAHGHSHGGQPCHGHGPKAAAHGHAHGESDEEDEDHHGHSHAGGGHGGHGHSHGPQRGGGHGGHGGHGGADGGHGHSHGGVPCHGHGGPQLPLDPADIKEGDGVGFDMGLLKGHKFLNKPYYKGKIDRAAAEALVRGKTGAFIVRDGPSSKIAVVITFTHKQQGVQHMPINWANGKFAVIDNDQLREFEELAPILAECAQKNLILYNKKKDTAPIAV